MKQERDKVMGKHKIDGVILGGGGHAAVLIDSIREAGGCWSLRPGRSPSKRLLRRTLRSLSLAILDELRDVLQRSGFTLETTTREWYLAGTIQVLNFLARHHKLLMTDNGAFFTHNLSHSLRNVDLAKANGFTVARAGWCGHSKY